MCFVVRMNGHREIQEIKIINCESGFFSFYTDTLARTHTRLIFVFSLFLLLSGDYYNLYIAIQSDSFNGECLSWHSITRPYCLCHFYFYVMLCFRYVCCYRCCWCCCCCYYFLFICFLICCFFRLLVLAFEYHKKCVRATTFRTAEKKRERSICLVQYWQRAYVGVHTLTHGHCLVIYKLVLSHIWNRHIASHQHIQFLAYLTSTLCKW